MKALRPLQVTASSGDLLAHLCLRNTGLDHCVSESSLGIRITWVLVRVAWLVGVLSSVPEGHKFNSHSGHVPRLLVWFINFPLLVDNVALCCVLTTSMVYLFI